MEEIFALVDQELVRSGYKKLIGAGVVLTGGGALIQGAQDLAEQVFNVPVRVGFPKGVGGLTDVVKSSMFATAVGLLLYGAEKAGLKRGIRIRDKNMFNRILTSMKKWFVDIS
jgi:cell division protein FtsA